MVYSLTWLAKVLLDAGLKVSEQPDWRDRGRREMGTIKGVICHHTAGPRTGIMPSLGTITHGRSDLPGPLAQLGLGRDGTFFIVAAGRANHAGEGVWQGLTTGNSNFIGIEAENSGAKDDPWPKVQMDAYQRGVAAILSHVGAKAIMCCGHREYALPRGRKPDPSFNMDEFRSKVSAIMDGAAPPPVLIPPIDAEGRPTLRRGAKGELVEQIQTKLGVTPADGDFGPRTEAEIRSFQAKYVEGEVPDGIVGPKTWAALDKL